MLGTAGGGGIPVNPADAQGLQTVNKTFQFRVQASPGLKRRSGSESGSMHFSTIGYEPLALQLFRSVRQLFLRRFQCLDRACHHPRLLLRPGIADGYYPERPVDAPAWLQKMGHALQGVAQGFAATKRKARQIVDGIDKYGKTA